MKAGDSHRHSELRKLLRHILRRKCFGHFSQSAFLLRPASPLEGHWRRHLTQWWLSMKAGRREIILKQDGSQQTLWTSLLTTESSTGSSQARVQIAAVVSQCLSSYLLSCRSRPHSQQTPQSTSVAPAMRFLTREFGGFPDELDWTIQAAELFELATAAGLQPKSEPHWTAGYDGPSVIVNRRNEVWLELEATV